MSDSPWLAAQVNAAVSAELNSPIAGGLIADVVRGVLDEHRQDALLAPEPLILESRHRPDRIERARSDDTSKERL